VIVDSESSKTKKDMKKKKHIKKIVYYDSTASSSSPKEDDDDLKKKTVKQHYSKTSFTYSCIPYGSNAHLLSIGKPPYFGGEDYSWWSHKMRSIYFHSTLAFET
jgi:hypothetical protein